MTALLKYADSQIIELVSYSFPHMRWWLEVIIATKSKEHRCLQLIQVLSNIYVPKNLAPDIIKHSHTYFYTFPKFCRVIVVVKPTFGSHEKAIGNKGFLRCGFDVLRQPSQALSKSCFTLRANRVIQISLGSFMPFIRQIRSYRYHYHMRHIGRIFLGILQCHKCMT